MDRRVDAAATLPESARQDLAVQALARSATVSDLAARHGTSRKFVYQQMHKAGAALDDAFLSATPDEEALFTFDEDTNVGMGDTTEDNTVRPFSEARKIPPAKSSIGR